MKKEKVSAGGEKGGRGVQPLQVRNVPDAQRGESKKYFWWGSPKVDQTKWNSKLGKREGNTLVARTDRLNISGIKHDRRRCRGSPRRRGRGSGWGEKCREGATITKFYGLDPRSADLGKFLKKKDRCTP